MRYLNIPDVEPLKIPTEGGYERNLRQLGILNALAQTPGGSLNALQTGMGTDFPLAVDLPTLQDPFDRARALSSLAVQGGVDSIAGLSGIGALSRTGDPQRATRAIEETRAGLQPLVDYVSPKTEAGKAAQTMINYPFEKIAEGAQWAGDKIFDYTGSPWLATGVNTAINATPILAGVRGGLGKAGRTSPDIISRVEGQPQLGYPTPKLIELNESFGKMAESLYKAALPERSSVGYTESKGGLPNATYNRRLNDAYLDDVASKLNTTRETIDAAVLDYQVQGRQSPAFKAWSGDKPVHRLESVDVANPKPGVVLAKSSQFKGIENWDVKKATENSYSGFNNPNRMWLTTEKGAEAHLATQDPALFETSEFYVRTNNPISIEIQGKKATQDAMAAAQEAGHDVAFLYDKDNRYVVDLNAGESTNVKAKGNVGTFSETPMFFYEGFGKTLEDLYKGAVGKQQTASKAASILEDAKYAERQPVGEWVKTLRAKGIPKDEPAVLKVLSDLGATPVKQRLTKGEVQQMLNSYAPELETVIAENPTHGNMQELFVRDPNEYKPLTEEQRNRKTDLTIEKSKAMTEYQHAVTGLEKFWKEHYKKSGGFEEVYGPEKDRMQFLMEKRDKYSDRLNEINKELSAFPEPRYDGHAWAKQKELSSPIGRVRMETRVNDDGTKTLIIDNFQKPTEGSGQRELMPKEHETRAYDLMTQSVLNYARENGFRDVEWTTGAEQNARWGVETVEDKYNIVDKNGERLATVMNVDTANKIANEYGGKVVKLTPEGDLRPVYDKTLPQLVEKYGQGQKVGQGAQIDLANNAGADFDVDPGRMESAITEAIEGGTPTISGQAKKFNQEFLETGGLFGDLLIDKPELKDWLTRYFYGESTERRQAINVEGQKPQTLLYEAMGRALYDSLKGVKTDTRDSER